MLKLYFAQGTCAMASHIALAEADAPYSVQRISFEQNEQRSPAYLAVNPKGRVPALITDRGILTETPAILVYIAQTFPNAALAPLDDPFEFARAQSFNSYLCSTLHINHAHRMRGHRWVDDAAALEAMKAKVPQTVGDSFELIETRMFDGPWVLGDRYSVCDGYLFTVARWIKGDGIDPARFPKIIDHMERMQQRPAVQRALAEERG